MVTRISLITEIKMTDKNETSVLKSSNFNYGATKVNIKYLPFWEKKTDVWFSQAETQFSITNIIQNVTIW